MAIGPFTLEYLIAIAPQFKDRSGLSLLELGEAQTVDFDLADYLDRIAAASTCPRETMDRDLAQARDRPGPGVLYAEARLIYKWLLKMESYRAVDLGSADPQAWIDLNYPVDLGRRFDIVVNNGTSEHVFNQANVFKVIHDHTVLGGSMIHYTTGLGWVEHGFYNLQPSFFFDLAKYNGYEVHSCCLVNDRANIRLEVGKINGDSLNQEPLLRNALLHSCMRRWDDAPFRFPIQRPYQPSN